MSVKPIGDEVPRLCGAAGAIVARLFAAEDLLREAEAAISGRCVVDIPGWTQRARAHLGLGAP